MASGQFYSWCQAPRRPRPCRLWSLLLWAGPQIQLTARVWGSQQIRGIEAEGVLWAWRTEPQGFWFRALGHPQGPRPPVPQEA